MGGDEGQELPRVGYLGPAGTFSEEALQASAVPGSLQPVAITTIYDTVSAVREGEVRWAVVPIENSLDGSVTVTLDLLADERGGLEIVGEALLAVRHSLIACEPVAIGEIDTVISHPQVPGQCTRLLRGELAHAQVLPASSTAEAVRTVSTAGVRGQAALGTRLAADIYGGTVIRAGVQDRDDNVTRFVWLARAPANQASEAGQRTGPDPPPLVAHGEGGWKTSVVFWGPGADSPGWLVTCLNEFARRSINLTKIESRPRRATLGHYMFFVDLQGSVAERAVADAIEGLRAVCEHVRVLGSYLAAA
ncbi:MAG TPA: prephenate dehydratase [Solirubrobacteraceae bacterium]|jgi:prephenate dehydratase